MKTEREIQERVRGAIMAVVMENSGGVKFAKLLVALVSKLTDEYEFKYEEVEKYITPDNIERVIRNEILELRILTYTYPDLNREKMFVYFP